jgi:hypothetical protein
MSLEEETTENSGLDLDLFAKSTNITFPLARAYLSMETQGTVHYTTLVVRKLWSLRES